MRLPEPYLPKSYKGRVHWYISPARAIEPIHLFRSRQQARAWAKTQPDIVIGGVVMIPNFDWFPKRADPKDTISSTRDFVDHRDEDHGHKRSAKKRKATHFFRFGLIESRSGWIDGYCEVTVSGFILPPSGKRRCQGEAKSRQKTAVFHDSEYLARLALEAAIGDDRRKDRDCE